MTRDDLVDGAIGGGGLLVALIVGNLVCRGALALLERGGGDGDDRPTGYPGAGRLIGLLERAIAFGCIVAGAPGGIAALLVVKTAARFGETRNDHRFAEQFIVGTLVSLAFAVVAGVVVRAIIGIEPTVP